MDTDHLFLISDAALRSVIDRLSPADLDREAPASWTAQTEHPTLRDIVKAHAYDEAWVPDVLAGKAAADGDPWRERDLLGEKSGDDPIAAYDALNDTATSVVSGGVDPEATVHFTYGDYPASEGLVHMALYRAFQSWLIAHHVGQDDYRLSDELLDGLEEHVLPHVDMWRQFGVFPPAVEPPADADRETRLLCTTGFWHP